MAEAIGLGASIAGLATFGAQIVTSLRTYASAYQRAEHKINDLSSDLALINSILTDLGTSITKYEVKFHITAKNFIEVKKTCERNFEKLSTALKEVKRDDLEKEGGRKKGKLGAWEKLKFALGGETELKEFLLSIESSKSTLQLLLESFKLFILLRLHELNEEQMEDIKLLNRKVPVLVRGIQRAGLANFEQQQRQLDRHPHTDPITVMHVRMIDGPDIGSLQPAGLRSVQRKVSPAPASSFFGESAAAHNESFSLLASSPPEARGIQKVASPGQASAPVLLNATAAPPNSSLSSLSGHPSTQSSDLQTGPSPKSASELFKAVSTNPTKALNTLSINSASASRIRRRSASPAPEPPILEAKTLRLDESQKSEVPLVAAEPPTAKHESADSLQMTPPNEGAFADIAASKSDGQEDFNAPAVISRGLNDIHVSSEAFQKRSLLDDVQEATNYGSDDTNAEEEITPANQQEALDSPETPELDKGLHNLQTTAPATSKEMPAVAAFSMSMVPPPPPEPAAQNIMMDNREIPTSSNLQKSQRIPPRSSSRGARNFFGSMNHMISTAAHTSGILSPSPKDPRTQEKPREMAGLAPEDRMPAANTLTAFVASSPPPTPMLGPAPKQKTTHFRPSSPLLTFNIPSDSKQAGYAQQVADYSPSSSTEENSDKENQAEDYDVLEEDTLPQSPDPEHENDELYFIAPEDNTFSPLSGDGAGLPRQAPPPSPSPPRRESIATISIHSRTPSVDTTSLYEGWLLEAMPTTASRSPAITLSCCSRAPIHLHTTSSNLPEQPLWTIHPFSRSSDILKPHLSPSNEKATSNPLDEQAVASLSPHARQEINQLLHDRNRTVARKYGWRLAALTPYPPVSKGNSSGSSRKKQRKGITEKYLIILRGGPVEVEMEGSKHVLLGTKEDLPDRHSNPWAAREKAVLEKAAKKEAERRFARERNLRSNFPYISINSAERNENAYQLRLEKDLRRSRRDDYEIDTVMQSRNGELGRFERQEEGMDARERRLRMAMSTPHRGLPLLPTRLQPPQTGQLPAPPKKWHGAEESMKSWLSAKAEEDKRKQEEERTRQESLKLEQRKIDRDMLRVSTDRPLLRRERSFDELGRSPIRRSYSEWERYRPPPPRTRSVDSLSIYDYDDDVVSPPHRFHRKENIVNVDSAPVSSDPVELYQRGDPGPVGVRGSVADHARIGLEAVERERMEREYYGEMRGLASGGGAVGASSASRKRSRSRSRSPIRVRSGLRGRESLASAALGLKSIKQNPSRVEEVVDERDSVIKGPRDIMLERSGREARRQAQARLIQAPDPRDGYGYRSQSERASIPRHHHPTRLDDTLEEDERERTSEKGSYRGEKGKFPQSVLGLEMMRSNSRDEDEDHEEYELDSQGQKVVVLEDKDRPISSSAGATAVKGILRAPREKFPEKPKPIREGVAPLAPGINPDARWTKIKQSLVTPEALKAGKERFEIRGDSVIVLRILSTEEIQRYADMTARIRALDAQVRRRAAYTERSDLAPETETTIPFGLIRGQSELATDEDVAVSEGKPLPDSAAPSEANSVHKGNEVERRTSLDDGASHTSHVSTNRGPDRDGDDVRSEAAAVSPQGEETRESVRSLAQGSKYQFEADSTDEEAENEIDSNLDALGSASGRLNTLARTTGMGVEAQGRMLDKLVQKTDRVDDTIVMNRAGRDRIHTATTPPGAGSMRYQSIRNAISTSEAPIGGDSLEFEKAIWVEEKATIDHATASEIQREDHGGQQWPTAEDEEEEDITAAKEQLRRLKQGDIASTRNAAVHEAEISRTTLAQLGARAERIHNTERNLDLASERAKELKRLERGMFAVHVSIPSTASARKAAGKEGEAQTHLIVQKDEKPDNQNVTRPERLPPSTSPMPISIPLRDLARPPALESLDTSSLGSPLSGKPKPKPKTPTNLHKGEMHSGSANPANFQAATEFSLDSLQDFSEYDKSSSQSPSSQLVGRPASNTPTTLLSNTQQGGRGSSHSYDIYKQSTGIPQGALASDTHAGRDRAHTRGKSEDFSDGEEEDVLASRGQYGDLLEDLDVDVDVDGKGKEKGEAQGMSEEEAKRLMGLFLRGFSADDQVLDLDRGVRGGEVQREGEVVQG